MTPKEKAENMYNNYSIDVKFTMEDCSWTYRGNNYELCVKKTAKQCAINAVDEILEISYWQYMESGGQQEQIYWQQVKHEIEKL